MQRDSNTVSMGLRLGTTLCCPHVCRADVNHLGTHGLSCVRSEGCHHQHAALNDIVHRALTVAHIPSRLEPSGIFPSDGKRPDGITVVPWKSGRLLVWDATCPDTFVPMYLPNAASGVGVLRKSRRSESSLTGVIHSSQSPLRLQGSLVQIPCNSCGSWAVASSWCRLITTPSPT